VERLEREGAGSPAAEHAARAERAVAEHLIAERLRHRLTAIRIEPPEYIVRELGERPADPAERETWDRAVAGIETYRFEHGIGDRDSILEAERHGATERRQQGQARESISRAQRQLGIEQAPAVHRNVDLGIEI
jgi:hypothetical protein